MAELCELGELQKVEELEELEELRRVKYVGLQRKAIVKISDLDDHPYEIIIKTVQILTRNPTLSKISNIYRFSLVHH